jgi:subtilisin family serine protease
MLRIQSTLAAVSLALVFAHGAAFRADAPRASHGVARTSALSDRPTKTAHKATKRKRASRSAPVAAKAAAPSPIVAVIDSGVDVTHPALRDHLWVNPGEVPGNGVDDDHDGFVDDVNGANLTAGNGDLGDDIGHGTHVAGIVLQTDPAARIMALKAGSGGTIDLGAATAAINYAVSHGARVINLSWATFSDDAALAQAIRSAVEHDVLVVAAAGNFGFDTDVRAVYPASYGEAGLLSVAATCDGHSAASFSNFGKVSVGLAAPGCGISSTLPGGGYGALSGTSMAAPAVSGTAALLLSQRPQSSAQDLERSILGGAVPDAGLAASVSSGATLSVSGALAALAAPDRTAPAAFNAVAPAAAFTTERDPSYYYQPVTFTWTASSDQALAGYRVLLDGHPIGAPPSATSVTARVAPGAHTWTVVAYDRSGNETVAAQ